MAELVSTYQPLGTMPPKASEYIQSVAGAFGAMGKVVQAQEQQYEQKIEFLKNNQQIAYDNIVTSGSRKELIAILNAIYESGLINNKQITKAEFFQRASILFGDSGMKDYATALSQVILAYKYDDIFHNLTQTAQQYREKSDKK